MRIIFFGSSSFALNPLKALLEKGHNVVCVVTQPDRKKGRGFHLARTTIKEFAQNKGLRIYQPEKVNTQEAANFLKGLDADLFVVIAYGQILSQYLLKIPRVMAINCHASILPRYRGAAPINWAIIRAEKETGVTIIKMTEKMDAGPLIAQKKIQIEESDTDITLSVKLSIVSARLLLKTIAQIENSTYQEALQDEKQATFAPKLKRSDGIINWNAPAEKIHNLAKGYSSWPSAFTHYKGKILKIYKTKIIEKPIFQGPAKAGEILQISKEGILVNTAKYALLIEELQIEGKRKMTAQDFIAGHKLQIGDIFI